jgi:tetratricopeptide (TPR) repeat protein
LRDEADAAATKGKPDYTKVRAVMQEFVEKYPDHEKTYAAFDYSAQLLVKEEKLDEAIKTYEDFIAKFPQSPAVPRAYLAIATNYRVRAEKLGPYLSLSNEDQGRWTTYMDAALKYSETGIEKFPESDTVSNLLDVALKIDTLRVAIGIRKGGPDRELLQGLGCQVRRKQVNQGEDPFRARRLPPRSRQGEQGQLVRHHGRCLRS